MDPPNAVPANAFVNVTLSGATPDGTSLLLDRGVPRPNKPYLLDDDAPKVAITGKRPPKRLPSKLPPPGNLSLHLTLGNKIGRGRVGRVYEATVDLTKSSPELSKMVLPPLVVKISRRHDAKRLAREAYYYEEMECLQGCAIARYYGLYRTVIHPTTNFLPWTHDKINRKPGCHGDYSDESGSDSGSDSEDVSKIESDEDEDDEDDKDSEVYSSDEGEPAAPTVVSILILERLGDRMPLGKRLPSGIQNELETVYSDLAQLGVDHCDIRYYNILRAPSPGSSPLPSLPSPFTKRIYGWRLVDFDNACKTNTSPMVFYGYHYDLLVTLIYNLPWGEISEPWD